ncbi:ectopic P granules protein 5 [Pelomyxa schiedti]|nr:ectopic P granules protein 5 [Pelomyxa schiedti]
MMMQAERPRPATKRPQQQQPAPETPAATRYDEPRPYTQKHVPQPPPPLPPSSSSDATSSLDQHATATATATENIRRSTDGAGPVAVGVGVGGDDVRGSGDVVARTSWASLTSSAIGRLDAAVWQNHGLVMAKSTLSPTAPPLDGSAVYPALLNPTQPAAAITNNAAIASSGSLLYPELHAFISNTQPAVMSGENVESLQSRLKRMLDTQQECAKEDARIGDIIRAEDPLYHSDFWKLVSEYHDKQQIYEHFLPELLHHKNQCREIQTKLWDVKQYSVSVKGTCRICGGALTCEEVCHTATLNNENAAKLRKTLEEYKEAAQNRFVKYVHEAHLSRLRVCNYIDTFLFQVFGSLPPDSPITVYPDDYPSSRSGIGLEAIAQLRHMIHVLFSFISKGAHYGAKITTVPSSNSQICGTTITSSIKSPADSVPVVLPLLSFYKDLACWISQLVNSLYRVASFSDHLCILKHFLNTQNCSLIWPNMLIQLSTTWDKNKCEHILTVLRYIFQIVPAPPDEVHTKPSEHPRTDLEVEDWIVVNPAKWLLTENDLLSIIKQVPLTAFCEYVCSEMGIYSTGIEGCAWLEKMLMILCRNMGKLSEFRELMKLLSKTCISLLNAIANQHVKRHIDTPSSAINELFLAVAYSLLPIHSSGVWQFLCNLPFHRITSETAWHFLCLAYGLQQADTQEPIFACDKKSWDSFMAGESFHRHNFASRLAGVEAVFLVQSLISLAKNDDTDLACVILTELFYVSFLESSTREGLYQATAGLLSELCLVHPSSISWLLELIQVHFRELGKTLIEYILSQLSFLLWEPKISDVAIIRSWLFSPMESSECAVARSVLSRINWATPPTASQSVALTNNLFLSPVLVRDTALLVLEAWAQHYRIYQQSSLLQWMWPHINTFTQWCWEFLFSLSLFYRSAREQPPEPLSLNDPVASILNENLKAFQAHMNNFSHNLAHPLPLYLVLLLTQFGRDPTNWFGEGSTNWSILSFLVYHKQYMATLWVLSEIVPVVVVANHPHMDISPVMKATWKELMSVRSNVPRCSRTGNQDKLKSFPVRVAQVIVSQVLRLQSPIDSFVSAFWFQFLTSVDNWNTNEATVVVLDHLLFASFTGGEGRLPIAHCQTAFSDAYKRHLELKPYRWWGSAWFKGGNAEERFSSLLSLQPSSEWFGLWGKNCMSDTSWLVWSILFIEAQYESVEREKLANEIRSMKPTPAQLDSILYQLKVSQCGNWALSLQIDTPIAPVMWQLFFYLYFDFPSGLNPCSLMNTPSSLDFKQRISKKLFEYSDYHSKSAKTASSPQLERHQQLADLYTAMTLWLKMTDIHPSKSDSHATAVLSSVLPTYLPDRLYSVLTPLLFDTSKLWNDLIIVNKDKPKKIKKHFDLPARAFPPTWSRQLNSSGVAFVEDLFGASPMSINLPLVLTPDFRATPEFLSEELRPMKQLASAFATNLTKHQMSNDLIFALSDKLYTTEQYHTTKEQTCPKGCAPALFSFQLFRIQKDKTIEEKIEEANNSIKQCTSSIQTNERICLGVLQIETALNAVVMGLKDDDSTRRQQYASLGLQILRQLQDFMSHPDTHIYPPISTHLPALINFLSDELHSLIPLNLL